MAVRDRDDRGASASEHIVQFFDSDESRAECVARFLADGHRLGERAIIIAKPSNWSGVVEQLKILGVPVEDATAAGTIVVKDATDTLRRVCRSGVPDAEAFDAAVGKAAAELARPGGRIRAYGEMVDMLAQRGEMAEAIKLEHLWNRLGERVPLFLMCGYSAAHFVATATHRALREICGAHTGVHRHAQDPLATWLLNSAHNAPGASAMFQ
jgi:hypothetical protein